MGFYDRSCTLARVPRPTTPTPRSPVKHPRHENAPELKVSGLNACRALFRARPDDIRKVFVTDEVIPSVGDLLKWCAQQRIAYKVVGKDDLLALTDTPHHDGICLLARLLPTPSFDDVLRAVDSDDAPLVLLEDVKNPHNLGAILRVCAHFGVRFVLAAGETPELSPAAMRTAEGGAEHVRVVHVGDGKTALHRLKDQGFAIVATSSHVDDTLVDARLPARAVLLFGSESSGLSRALSSLADAHVQIPGSGALESLNVACASSVLLWEHWRVHARASTSTRAPSRPPHGPPRDAAGPSKKKVVVSGTAVVGAPVNERRRSPNAPTRGSGGPPRRRR